MCDYGYNIEIGENFYANHNLIILDGNKVEFGDNVVIGAGSIVNKDIPSNIVAVGNPCRVIKKIDNNPISFFSKYRANNIYHFSSSSSCTKYNFI